MSTKIKLKFPYSEDFVSGYLNTNKEPRRVVLLVRKDKSLTSTSYARYLMSCNLGRYLDRLEQVDHIDGDKMNDVIDNFQILSPQENSAKGRSRTFLDLVCPICGNEFKGEVRNVRYKIKKGKTPTCSRSCGGKMGHITKQRDVV